MKPEQSHSSILKEGSRGEEVKQLQQKLAIIGYAPGPADGVFGAKTKAAVIAFQKDAGLTQDTIVLHESFVRDKLQMIRSHFNAAVTFNSAYRTPEHNQREGGTPNSYHLKGRAFDIVVKGKTPAEVARYAASIGIKGIIQYNTFVHVDSRAVKYWAKKINGRETKVDSF